MTHRDHLQLRLSVSNLALSEKANPRDSIDEIKEAVERQREEELRLMKERVEAIVSTSIEATLASPTFTVEFSD